MKQDLISVFFLGDESFYKECMKQDISYYLTQIQLKINEKNPPYEKQKLVPINLLLKTIANKFNNKDLNSISLNQFFNFIYHADRLQYSTSLENHINQLIAYYSNLKRLSSDLNAYKKTVAYPNPVDLYFNSNNKLHNQILDISKEFNLDAPTREELEHTALGNTPLILACKIGHTKAALVLLHYSVELGVDINKSDERGMTALHWACFYRDKELIQKLLEAGASTHLTNQDGDTALNLYKKDLDPDTTIHAGKKGFLHYIPSIADGQLRYVRDGKGEKKSAWLDILFHMDKIAVHQLNINPSQLNEEVLAVESQLPLHTLETQPNVVFEIFNFYHFNDFIRARNDIKLEEDLAKRLSPQLSMKKEIQKKEKSAESTLDELLYSNLKENLIEKVTAYLKWRANKDLAEDNRNYKMGIFTKLRHWTQFGEDRATSLRKNLTNAKSTKEINQVLLQHFSKNSRLHNHSLDTYLLEGCAQNGLFPLPDHLLPKEGRQQYFKKVVGTLEGMAPTLSNNPIEIVRDSFKNP